MSAPTHIAAWLERLGYSRVEGLVSTSTAIGDRAYAAEIGDMLSPDLGINATHVFCVDDTPVACFVDLTDVAAEVLLDEVRQRVWNQGLATVVIGLSPEALAAYSVLRRHEKSIELSFDDASVDGPWSPYDFITGAIQRRVPSWFEPERRVDQSLLDSLTALINNLAPDIQRRPAEALVAQIIFLRYLEDRGIVADTYRTKHQVGRLQDLVAKSDGVGVDRLISELGETFAGDFLRNTGFSPPPWSSLSSTAFRHIGEFLSGENAETHQLSFWSYDFSVIPVELISSIYESFFGERKRSHGAYYTPRNLATLAVQMTFETGPAAHHRRVFDGACGSGILLTTAFQKMLASAEAEAGRKLAFSERVKLMQDRVFGGDIDSTACWITAFSLCLCLLARLTPADIAALQEDEGVQLPRLIGEEGANIRAGIEHGDFFNLAHTDASAEHTQPVVSECWDVILSNPPWREGKGPPERFEITIAATHGDAPLPDRQIAAAYAYLAASRTAPDGTLTLILPLNLMIGIDSAGFREKLLELVQIDRIVNFGDVRFLLFPMAKLSCALVVARPRPLAAGELFAPSERVEYWTPKADLALALGCLVVSHEDQALLSPATIYSDPAILIHRYWGRARDLAILNRLRRFGTIKTVAEARDWAFNKGFHKTDTNNPAYKLDAPAVKVLWDKKFLATRALPKEHPVVTAEPVLPLVRDLFETVATPGGDRGRLYIGNRVLWRNGLAPDRRVRAVFSDVPFAFQHTTCAIGGVKGDADLLKFLAVYLRSSLTGYFMVLNSFSAIADRSAVSKYEIMTLPFASLDGHPDPECARNAVKGAAAIIDRIAREPEFIRGYHYETYRPALDALVGDFFGLSDVERAIVEETARDIAPSLQPRGFASVESALTTQPDAAVGQRYADALASALARFRQARKGEGGFEIAVDVGAAGRVFGSVRIGIKDRDRSLVEAASNVQQLLADLSSISPDRALVRMADTILAVGESLFLIKPLQRRFWGMRAALEDCDKIMAAIDGTLSETSALAAE